MFIIILALLHRGVQVFKPKKENEAGVAENNHSDTISVKKVRQYKIEAILLNCNSNE